MRHSQQSHVLAYNQNVANMHQFWLKVAAAMYSVGLLYAFVALSGKRQVLSRTLLPIVGLGTIFHFVAMVESFTESGQFTPATLFQSESLLAFLLMFFFFIVYWKYSTTSHGIFVFPLVFLLTLSAAVGERPPQFDNPALRGGWIITHIALILAGYAALFFSFVSSILYLVQERSLKTKVASTFFSRLPALEVMDDIGFRSLLLGFPFMTIGLVIGSVIAQSTFGPAYFRDPKIVLSLLMWAVYMVLLFSRWSAGWRGRRAAMLSACAFMVAAVAWAANYFSAVHRFPAP